MPQLALPLLYAGKRQAIPHEVDAAAFQAVGKTFAIVALTPILTPGRGYAGADRAKPLIETMRLAPACFI